jgi:hypothetical protein
MFCAFCEGRQRVNRGPDQEQLIVAEGRAPIGQEGHAGVACVTD